MSGKEGEGLLASRSFILVGGFSCRHVVMGVFWGGIETAGNEQGIADDA